MVRVSRDRADTLLETRSKYLVGNDFLTWELLSYQELDSFTASKGMLLI